MAESKLVTIGAAAKKIGKTTASGAGATVKVGASTPVRPAAPPSGGSKTAGAAGTGDPGSTSGTTGTTGANGATGAFGASDTTGTTGTNGTNGANGSTGSKGGEVGIRDYVSASGYGNIVDWDGENVLVGGVPIVPTRVVDGKAYAPRSAVEDAVRSLESRNGIRGADGVMAAYENKYGKELRLALDALLNREAFSYDPEADPAYQAYREQYLREAEAAYRRVLNDNDTSVTGASGAVLSEALASRDDYLRRLADTIPVLEQNAYQRYTGETDRLRGNLSELNALADTYYDRLYTADRDAVAGINAAGKAESAEKQRWIENERADTQNRLAAEQQRLENERNAVNDAYQNALNAQSITKNDIELQYYPDMLAEQLRGDRIENNQAEIENAMTNAVSRGFFTRADESVMPWIAAYRNAYGGYTVTPWEAQTRYEYDIEHAKKLADYRAKFGM